MRAGRLGVTALVVTAIALTSVSAVAGAAGKAPAPEGYVRVPVEEAGFSVVVPEAWEPVVITRKDARKVLRHNQQLEELGVSADTAVSSPLTAGWDEDGDGFAERYLNVDTSAEAFVLPDPDELSEMLDRESKGLMREVSARRTRVGGRAGLVNEYDMDLTRADGVAVSVHAEVYWVVLHSPTVVALQFVRPSDRVDPEFDEQIATVVASVKATKR